MKKLFIITLLAVCFVVSILPSVSALEFDNVKSYDEENQEITITNAFGLGVDIAKVTLDTPLVLRVIPGENRLVAEFTIENLDGDYSNVFKQMDFYNIKQGGLNFQRDFTYKKEVFIGNVQVDTFTTFCEDVTHTNGTVQKICEINKTGEVTNANYEWVELTSELTTLSAGNITIGIFTDVLKGDTVEWIPTLFGVEIDEWAVWTDSLDLGLQNYYNLSKSSGNAIDSIRGDNATNFNSVDQNVEGIIGLGAEFDGANAFNETSGAAGNFSQNFTINLWVNATTIAGGNRAFLSKLTTGATDGWGYDIQTASNEVRFFFWEDDGDAKSITGGTTIVKDSWNMITTIGSSSNVSLFINGVFSASANHDGTIGVNDLALSIGGTPNTNEFFIGVIDEVGLWNRTLSSAEITQLYNGGDGITYAPEPTSGTITTTLNAPSDNSDIEIGSTILFNATARPQLANLTNATFYLYNSSTGNILRTETINVTGTLINESEFNATGLSGETFKWNVLFCGINDTATSETICEAHLNNFTFSIVLSEISSSFSEFTYETSSETYETNVTLLSGQTIDSVNLFYNGTSHSGTSTLISGDNYTLQAIVDIPLSAVGENTTQFFFSLNLNDGQTNLTVHNQSVGAINLSLFGQGGVGLPYINFTFKNETTAQEDVSATFSSTWTYYLGTGAINKTLLFTNASENKNYSFQFHPQNRTLFTDMSVDYTNTDSQQRTFDPTTLTLTNNTLSEVLYLLPTANGIFQQFITQSIIGGTITDVNFVINRSIGGSSVQLTSGATDGSGFASIFLNPDFSHTASFTKTGFTDNVFSFQPSSQSRTVVMGTSAISANGSTISTNTNVTILPTNSSLNNGTDYLFSFTVQSTESINLITMNITNLSGHQVGFQTNSGVGTISQTINTGENISFIGVFLYSTDEETITFTKVWNIAVNFEGDYSIFKQLTLYTTYGFEDFIRLMIVIMVILSVLIFMSSTETIDTSESKVAVTVLLIWAFSVVGWLNTGVPVTDSGGFVVLSQYGNQYGIAILSTGLATFFMGRRLFT